MFHFSHLGVAVAKLETARREYEQIFGHRLVSGPFDDPVQRTRVCFLAREGEPTVELVAPLGDDSPVTRLLKSGGGAYHFCYEVYDLAAAIERMRAQRCLVVSQPVPAVAFEGRRIAWLFTPGRQLVELVEAPGSGPRPTAE